ncbi:MAG TPA: hypothetical protein VG013_05800, partial [Gemmataceae bacterium]|nr:hypothetical protein [Gemmataceae bacterium]
MLTSIAFVAALALAPAETSELNLNHVRFTYGVMGSTRPDTNFLPGDDAVLCFDVEGIQADDEGRVLYSVGMDVTDAKGKVQFSQKPRDLEANNCLGGNSFPAFARVNIGLDMPPGEYTLKVKVADRSTRASQVVTKTYTILPRAFGLVRLSTTSDAEGQAPLAAAGVGQTLWINFMAVEFGRKKGRPSLHAVLRVLDADGRPTMRKPLAGKVNEEVPKNLRALPMQFLLDLNRPGKFTVEVKVTDEVTGNKASLSFPLKV